VNTNRINAGQGFGYDKNGNAVSNVDPITSLIRTFLFNGDNKQYEVKDQNGTTTARYYYDGEGKRVKKKNEITGETTIFVYSSGKLVAEYSTVTPPANPTVNYTTTDHLGSPRIDIDANGQVTSRRDFLPFDEEITLNVGARSTAELPSDLTSGEWSAIMCELCLLCEGFRLY
jgi:YD repeat-containing protein